MPEMALAPLFLFELSCSTLNADSPEPTMRSARARRREDDLAPTSMTRKQVMDALRKGRSLVEADLRGADLTGLNFDGRDLSFTKLADADLSGCTFKGARLEGASMWHANLQGAVMDEAVLDFADLDCANIDGCRFRGARIKKTIFPNPRESLDQIESSIRTGQAIRLPRDDQDFE
jgi:uncharacterized protein YjbI with pentapeptide repeats